ncbi:LuxR C-terminal-related transcriptional regulator [Rugamonas apoptosis]|uniref:HTH luxR-type domain-containing protein n=1 Tax=Rugamonas apoptosis TaxID=2758570 RepID=A0A7W2F7X4_9BURK|nr:LuxR C-terminal-related transcriptional regulator [Rugamonas apoptosis]MBA5686669.1 hypothetical protein [Rugamonas apoptosis]
MTMRSPAAGRPQPEPATPPMLANGARGKLAPPYWAFEALRPRALLALIEATQLPKLVRVSAPPGYGKTVLLAELYRAQAARHRCLWLSLDDRDDSVAELAYLLDVALAHDGRDGAASRAGASLVAHANEAAADTIVDKIAHLARPTVIFIDNLQCCQDAQLGGFIDHLVFGSGAHVRIVIASTVAIPVDGARARLEIGGVDIGVDQLRFAYADIERLFLAAGGRLPQPPTLAAIEALTEGWPAAVRLLQVLVGEGWSDADVRQRFSGDDHDVAAVLMRSLLSSFEPPLVGFLQEMALLREFNAELAVHVSGTAQATSWIAQILERNALVFPLDRGQRWLRMHTLLRQHLLAQGRLAISAQRRRQLLERAAQWHAGHGDLATAIDLAIQIPALEQASGWLDRIARVVVGDQGRFALYIRWIDCLQAAGTEVSLNAMVWYVWALCFSLRYEQARGAIDAIDARVAAMEGQGLADRELDMRLGVMRVVVGVNLDALADAHREALLWLKGYEARDALGLATVASGAALVELAMGELDAAQRHMETASGAAERAGSPYGHAWVATVKASIHLQRGAPGRASDVLAAARPGVAELAGADSYAVAVMDFVHARALLDLGHVGEAREAAASGLRMAALHGVVDTVAQGLSCCVALAALPGETGFALDALEAVAHAYPPRLARMLCAARVRQLLLQGRIEEAKALARRGLPPGDATVPSQGDVLMAALELDAVGGGSASRWEAIASEVKRAQTQGRLRDLVELRLLACHLRLRDGDQRQALRQLSMALMEAAPQQLVWPLLSRAPQLQALLAQAKARDFGLTQVAELALLERLCIAAGAASAPAASVNDVQLDKLTAREVEFLQLLEQGLSNQQISDRTGRSVETVKWHLKNLYSKLGVKNRAAALARARILRILSPAS